MDEAIEPFLCGGISACFHSSGRRPTQNDLFTICVNEGANSSAHDFKNARNDKVRPRRLVGLEF